MSTQNPLKNFANCLNSVSDPRSKQGQSHPFATKLAILVLGLLAYLSTLAELYFRNTVTLGGNSPCPTEHLS